MNFLYAGNGRLLCPECGVLLLDDLDDPDGSSRTHERWHSEVYRNE